MGKIKTSIWRVFILAGLIALEMLGAETVFAQKEANFWYFGHHAGLNFNTSPPQVLFDSQASGAYGHATASSATGNLLFYFAGGPMLGLHSYTPNLNKQLFDRNHQPMPNGSGFHGTNAPSLFVPWPGTQKFYFFHFTYSQSFSGNSYSVIDMSLRNGLGDVTALKHVPFDQSMNNTYAFPVAVKHQNNRDFWVIYKGHGGDSTMRAYLISPAGLDTIPVISNIGTVGINIKASPDGRTLATTGITGYDLYNFDPATGLATHRFQVATPGSAFGPYEFSPDGTKFYIMRPLGNLGPGLNGDYLVQYDLTAGSNYAIQMSALPVQRYDSSSYVTGHLQAGPDGKIYQIGNKRGRFGGISPGKYLHVIHRPNVRGPACRVQFNAINVDPANTGNHDVGITLPSFVQSYFYRPRIDMQQTCFGDTARFDLSNRAYADSVDWNFGDPASGTFNTSKSFTPKHFYAAGGTYQVQAIVHFNFSSDTVLQTITIPHTIVKPNLGNDTTLCQGDTLRLRAYQFGATYEWQDSLTTDSVFTVTRPGDYWVQVSNGCGLRGDTIRVLFDQPLRTNFGPDVTLCPGQELTLKVTSAGGQILWQDSSTQQTFTVTKPGTYSVQVSNLCGNYSDTIRVNYRTLPMRWLPADTILCTPADVRLDATNPAAAEYLWQDGSRNPQFLAKYPGTYWVQIKTACNTTLRDSIRITYNQKPLTFFPPDTTVCDGDNHILKAPAALSYRWSTGDTTREINVQQAGLYKVIIETAPNCFFSDSVKVKTERCFKTAFLPNIVTPNNDNLNDKFEPKGLEAGTWELSIYNRWGVQIYHRENYTDQWPEKPVNAGTYYYLLRKKNSGKTYKGWVEVAK